MNTVDRFKSIHDHPLLLVSTGILDSVAAEFSAKLVMSRRNPRIHVCHHSKAVFRAKFTTITVFLYVTLPHPCANQGFVKFPFYFQVRSTPWCSTVHCTCLCAADSANLAAEMAEIAIFDELVPKIYRKFH